MNAESVYRIAYTTVLRLTRNPDDAHDIASDVVCRVLADPSVSDRVSVRTLARHCLIDSRRRSAALVDRHRFIAVNTGTEESSFDGIDAQEYIETRLAKCTDNQRIVLTTLLANHCNQTDTAAHLNCKPQYVSKVVCQFIKNSAE